MRDAIRLLTKEDHEANRPYTVGALLSPLTKTAYEWKYGYLKSWVIDQGDTDTCGGNSYEIAKSIQEGTHMNGLFTWMMARVRANMAVPDYGVSNRDLAMAGKKIGILRASDSPYDHTTPRDILASSTKWDIPKLTPKALPYIAGAVVWVEPAYGLDAFDMWCASTEKFEKMYDKPCPAVFGLRWNYDLLAWEIVSVQEEGMGHDMAIIGREGDYAIALQSYGLRAGNQGEVRIHRDIINRWASEFGCFIVVDATETEMKWAIENGLKLDANWLTNILVPLYNLLRDLLAQLKQHVYGIFTR